MNNNKVKSDNCSVDDELIRLTELCSESKLNLILAKCNIILRLVNKNSYYKKIRLYANIIDCCKNKITNYRMCKIQ